MEWAPKVATERRPSIGKAVTGKNITSLFVIVCKDDKTGRHIVTSNHGRANLAGETSWATYKEMRRDARRVGLRLVKAAIGSDYFLAPIDNLTFTLERTYGPDLKEGQEVLCLPYGDCIDYELLSLVRGQREGKSTFCVIQLMDGTTVAGWATGDSEAIPHGASSPAPYDPNSWLFTLFTTREGKEVRWQLDTREFGLIWLPYAVREVRPFNQ